MLTSEAVSCRKSVDGSSSRHALVTVTWQIRIAHTCRQLLNSGSGPCSSTIADTVLAVCPIADTSNPAWEHMQMARIRQMPVLA
jgi:hypothetical protein